jgi:hypothetical protein
LDLKESRAVDLCLKLCEIAEIVFEGNRPGVMERLGLGPDAMHARNPRLPMPASLRCYRSRRRRRIHIIARNRARGTFVELAEVIQPAPALRFSATPSSM